MIEDYQKAKKRGEREVRRAIAEGRNPYLPALDDFLLNESKLQKVYLGRIEIPTEFIVGTKNASRQSTFSAGFMPLAEEYSEFQMKWDRLYESHMEEGIRDPIEVVEYLKKFYVVEGNKRVSVMNFVGMHSCMAKVTRILPEKTNDPEIRVYYEFVEFFKAARFYDISFSRPGYYKMFASMLGQDYSDKWSEELVRRIRSAYTYFRKIFYAKGGKNLAITPGDAMLRYMQIYPMDSIIEESTAVLQNRISRLWKEFMTEAQGIDLVETPEDSPKNGSGSPILSIFRKKKYNKEHPLKVAFMYEGAPEHSSWLYSHKLGQNYIDQTMSEAVQTMEFENVSNDERLSGAIDEAVGRGAEIVFTTTSKQMDTTLKCAIHYPQTSFLNCSINLQHNAVRTYYARMYEAKFVMGALAASLSDSPKIGYLADMPVYGTIANINAFAIGVSLIYPQAKIVLKWSMMKDRDWRKEFAEEGVSVISGRNMIRPDSASREYGLYRVKKDGTIENIAFPVIDWGKYYEQLLETILENGSDALEAPKNGETVNYWWGMSAGVIDVILSGHLGYSTAKMIDLVMRGIRSGHLNPFDGEIHSQNGIVKEAGSKPLTSGEIITMDWLCDNVIGEIPQEAEMNSDAQETIHVIGAKR